MTAADYYAEQARDLELKSEQARGWGDPTWAAVLAE